MSMNTRKTAARICSTLLACSMLWTAGSGLARAEVSEVRIASGFGLQYLPLYVMKERGLLEKHAKEQGLGDVKVSWFTFSGGAALNDAVLSGAVDMAEGGVGPLAIIWDRTRNAFDVRAIAAMGDIPMTLITNRPDVKTVRDIEGHGQIAVPAVKASMQAVLVQMVAAGLYQDSGYQRLDPQTVTMKHADAAQAILAKAGVAMHFSVSPYVERELSDPSVHKITDSVQIIGGPMTLNTTYLKASFYDANPKVCAAYLAALQEAMDFINHDRLAAAQSLKKTLKLKEDDAAVEKMLSAPGVDFTVTPHGTQKFVAFMHQVGLIKHSPASWKDLFFPMAYKLDGN